MRVLSVTGSRSDYSAMGRMFEVLHKDPLVDHHLIVTGMLLNEEHVDLLAQIRNEAFGHLHFLPTFHSTGAQAMPKALAVGISGMTDLLLELQPDFVLLQGDRGEMLAGAIAAAHLNVCIVHLSGGDRTGSIDDSIRAAISKFSHLHLTTCDTSSGRLLAMGESAARIRNVGEPGLDVVLRTELIPFEEISREFDLPAGQPFLLACQHPVTTEVEQTAFQIEQTLLALEQTGLNVVFTYPNNDAGADIIVEALNRRQTKPWFRLVRNLGSRKFLSLLKNSAALVGNSSSGVWEAPSYRTPVINIGTRQHGRLRAGNVIDVDFSVKEIGAAISKVISDPQFRASLASVKNPYGDGQSSERVLDILKTFKAPKNFLAKWLDE